MAVVTIDMMKKETKCERPEGEEPAKSPSFRFFDLPYELRLRVYEYVLIHRKTIDLDPLNTRIISPLLRLFLVSHRMHDEAAPIFYGMNTFRILPIHGRFFHTDRPILARLSATYRGYITKAELYLGFGWTKPPIEWVIHERLGLEACKRLRSFKVYVRFDPSSHPAFEGFQEDPDDYTKFSINLVRDFFAQAPSLVEVELDAEPEVHKSSPLLQGAYVEAKAHGKRVKWGPNGEWNHRDPRVGIDLVSMLQSLNLGVALPPTELTAPLVSWT